MVDEFLESSLIQEGGALDRKRWEAKIKKLWRSQQDGSKR